MANLGTVFILLVGIGLLVGVVSNVYFARVRRALVGGENTFTESVKALDIGHAGLAAKRLAAVEDQMAAEVLLKEAEAKALMAQAEMLVCKDLTVQLEARLRSREENGSATGTRELAGAKPLAKGAKP